MVEFKYWYREHYLKGDCKNCPFFSQNRGIKDYVACFGVGEDYGDQVTWIACEDKINVGIPSEKKNIRDGRSKIRGRRPKYLKGGE